MRLRRTQTRRKKARGGRGKLLLPLAFLAFTGYFFHARVSRRVLLTAGERPAVQFRQLHHRWSRVSLLDVDLSCPGVRVEVAAAAPTPRASGCSDGAARTVADWCRTTGAVGGINGGFFGRELAHGRKEIVGLLKLDGELYARAPRYRAKSGEWSVVSGETAARPSPLTTLHSPLMYAHSALGFNQDGRPAIDWVVSDPRRPRRLLAFEHPEGLRTGLPWEIEAGLSGGPRLIARGRIAVSDRSERLASSGLLPRTFVAYDQRDGAPRHLVLGVATAMTFQDAALFLDNYYRRFHNLPCSEAMCLDGGPSSQLAYRADGVLYEAQSSDVTVPTCLIVQTDQGQLEEAHRSEPNTSP